MGHITVDLLEDAWGALNKAEHLATNDQTYGAVLSIENAVDDLNRCIKTMGFDSTETWFSAEREIRSDVGELSLDTNPSEELVLQCIEETRDLVKETEEHVIPELHTRIDYEPEPRYR